VILESLDLIGPPPLGSPAPHAAGNPLDKPVVRAVSTLGRHPPSIVALAIPGATRKGRQEAVMAFIQGTVPFEIDRDKPHKTYNIDFPIGPGRINNKDDVALVQKLLRFIYVETDHARNRGFAMPRGTPDIGVDGKFGPTTSKYILHFKQHVRSKGFSVFLDAVILPFGPDEFQRSVVTKTFYTMRLLLTSAENADDEAPRRSLNLLPANPDIPAELRDSLRVIKPQADGFVEGT
jgi:hypothetical protein